MTKSFEQPGLPMHMAGNAYLNNAPPLPYEQPDGRPFRLDKDYFGNPRNAQSPFPGPFELAGAGKHVLKVWPVAPAMDP